MQISIEKVPFYKSDDLKEIRRQVFAGMGITEDEIFDSYDGSSDQILIKLGNDPIGTARLRYEGKVAKLERMGILKNYQRKGYGKIALEKIIMYCKDKKVERILLHSILEVKNFYREAGFEETGNVFTRVGIPHVTMFLDLNSDP